MAVPSTQTPLTAFSRTSRFIGGLSLGYLHSAVLIVIGLWLTPYLLRHLGEKDYGLWILGAQVVAYLGLMDLGLVALLPRHVAFATGRVGDDRGEELRTLIGETASIVAWQTPAVAVVGFVIWWLIPGDWSPLRWPLAMVVLAFVVTFPLRIFPAVLQGLQDLTFLGGAQLVAWLIGTVFTVALVQAGFGLYSLAAGWVCTQILITFTAWHRLRHRSDTVAVYMPRLSMSRVRSLLGRGMWISVSQIAQVLLNGTELFVIGKLMGPAAVVPYACTAKLVTLLAHQPQLFMQMAMPALCELRVGVSRDRMFHVSTAMSQAMLVGSGAIACVTLAVNRPFVTWWVGPDRFAGTGLTALLLMAMLLRHWNVAVSYTLFCFGWERRLAVTGVLDGLVTVGTIVVLVPLVGGYGAVLGTLVGVCVVSLPGNLVALSREEEVGLIETMRPLGSWFLRFSFAAALVAMAITLWAVQGFWAGAAIAALVGIGYFILMIPILVGPPLGCLLVPRLRHWIASVPSRFRRLASQPSP